VNFSNLTTVCLLFATVLTALLPPQAAAATSAEASIEQQVSVAIQRAYQERVPESRVEVTVNPVNSALSLAPCNHPLQIELPFATGDRVTAKASCQSPRSWSLFLTARVQQFMTVVTARAPIRRNSKIAASSLGLSEQDVVRLDGGYFTRMQDVVGLNARTDIGLGEILSPHQLQEALAVLKGDRVTIEVRGNGLLIRAFGIALEDGRLGQRIGVRNERSGREISGTVSAAGVVSVP